MNAKPKLPRPKKCKAPSCGLKFQPDRQMQETCCIKCAIELTNLKRAKKEAKDAADVRKKKLAITKENNKRKREFQENDKSRQLKFAQANFNRFIRLRDKGNPCISCGKPDDGTHQRHASHYRSVGACSSLRFNEINVWASCSVCNNHLSGNIGEYRKALIRKIGIDKVEWIESQPKQLKMTIGEVIAIKVKYAKLASDMEKNIQLQNV